jgi:hypothetical protein
MIWVVKILGSTPHRSVGIHSMSHSTSISWLNDTLFLIYLTLDAEGLVKYLDVQMSNSPFIACYTTVDDLGTRGHKGVWGILDLCKRCGPRKKLCRVLMTVPVTVLLGFRGRHSVSLSWLTDTLFLIYLTLDAEGLVKYPDVQMSDSPFIACYTTVDDLGTRGHEGIWGILDLCKWRRPRKKLCQVLMTIPVTVLLGFHGRHSVSLGWLTDTLFLIYLTLDTEELVKYTDIQMRATHLLSCVT